MCGKERSGKANKPQDNSRNSLDPYYLVPHYYLGHIPSLFGSRWVYEVVGVLRVPRK